MDTQRVLKEYLEYKSTYTSKRTQEIYNSNLQKFFTYTQTHALGEYTDILAYSMQNIYMFTRHLQEHLLLKGSTVANYLVSIKSFFKYTREMGYTDLPYKLIKAPRYDEYIPEFVTEFEFDMIDEYLSEGYHELTMKRLIFRLLWETGARINEILSLTLDQVDHRTNSAIITRGKSKHGNILKWSDETNEILIQYLGVRLDRCPEHESLFLTPEKRVCVRGFAMQLTSRTVQRWCKELCHDLGIEKNISPHAFRHGKAHFIMNKTGRQEHVKGILGHKSIKSSDRYTRMNLLEQTRMQVQYL